MSLTLIRSHLPGPSMLRLGATSSWLQQTPTITRSDELTVSGNISFVMSYFDWLAAAVQGKPLPKDGEIVAYDYTCQPKTRYGFSQALITSLSFPTLDAASKDQAKLTVKMQLTGLTASPATGKPAAPTSVKAQNLWQCCNFKLTSAKFDASKVTRVEGLVVTPGAALPQLKLRIQGSATYQQVASWYQSTIGHAASAASADVCQIVCLAPEMSKLFSLELRGVRPVYLGNGPGSNLEDKLFVAELRVSFASVSLIKG
jgi:hypothetical protein